MDQKSGLNVQVRKPDLLLIGIPCSDIDFELVDRLQATALVEAWLKAMQGVTINVAGPRASSEPRIYEAVYALLIGIRWSMRND